MSRVVLAALLVVAATACSRGVSSDLAIYDWEAQRTTALLHGAQDLTCLPQACPVARAKHVYVLGAPKLQSADFDRDSVRVDTEPETGRPIVSAQFTEAGQRSFSALTKRLARRGREQGKPQHLLIAVDETVYTSPYIDYLKTPDGFSGSPGVEIEVATREEARSLARALRR